MFKKKKGVELKEVGLKEVGLKDVELKEVEPDRHSYIANRTCNLECTKGEPDGFTGLVKIILVETTLCEYLRKIWWAGLIGLAYIMIGSVTTMVFFFSLAMALPVHENLHVFLCTAGFQLLIPAGILMFSDLNGPSVPMKSMCRRGNHVLLQLSGVGCGLTGTCLLLGKDDNSTNLVTAHFFSGVFACILLTFSMCFGPFLIFTMKPNCFTDFFGPIHYALGATGFLASSVCLITGIMKPSIAKWLPLPDILYFLITFCVMYTMIVFFSPIIRCLSCKTDY